MIIIMTGQPLLLWYFSGNLVDFFLKVLLNEGQKRNLKLESVQIT